MFRHQKFIVSLLSLRHWLKVSISLLVVMGISWIIGVLTFHEALLFVSYIFTIVVAFQVHVHVCIAVSSHKHGM